MSDEQPPTKKRRNRSHQSCLPCAKAKRKCCKQLPCVNCQIRNIDCVYDAGAKPPPASQLNRPQPVEPKDPRIYSSYDRQIQSNITPTPSTISDGYPRAPSAVPSEIGEATLANSPFSDSSSTGKSGEASSMSTSSNTSAESGVLKALPVCPHSTLPASGRPLTESSIPPVGSAKIDRTKIAEPSTTATPARRETSTDMKCMPNFVLRLGMSEQRQVSRYFGPSSGPSLLLCRGPYTLSNEAQSVFPVDTIPDLESLLTVYHDSLHWYMSCFEWADLRKWLKTENNASVNALIYQVLSLACLFTGRDVEATLYERTSQGLFSDQLNGSMPEMSNVVLIIHMLRIQACDLRGRHEEAWIKMGLAINSATAMGYHREWPWPFGSEEEKNKLQSARSRIWYSLLFLERKMAIVLGRPYTIPPNMYNCPFPEVGTKFNFETSFRDYLNRIVPLYTEYLDELYSAEPSNRALMELDQKLSVWMYSLPPEMSFSFDISNLPSPCKHVVTIGRLYLACVKLFLRSRIHRIFVASENSRYRYFSCEQFLLSNESFCKYATEFIKYEQSIGTHDMTTFLVDQSLYYAIEVSISNQFYLSGNSTLSTYKSFSWLLQQVENKGDRSAVNASSARLAHTGLEIISALEKYKAGSSEDTLEKLRIVSAMLHPIEEISEGTTAVPLYPSSQTAAPVLAPGLSSRQPVMFDLGAWEYWLQDFPVDGWGAA